MSKFIFIPAFVSLAFSAEAALQVPGELTKVEANLRCEQPGGGVAVAYPTQSQPGRVWQTDPGEEMGLELEVIDFKVARCPGCFEFVAAFGDAQVRGSAVSYDFVYTYLDNGREHELLRARCAPTSLAE